MVNDDKQKFSDRLNAVLEAADVPMNKRQSLLAKICKVTGNAARKWLKGESIPHYETLLKIVEEFKFTGVTYEWLFGGDPKLSPFNNAKEEYANYYANKNMEMPAWRVPVISWVRAGDYSECFDNYRAGSEDWVGTTTKPNKLTFALRVMGDSMEPKFNEGMLIIVEPEFEALPGDYVIAKNGNEATFKQLIKDGSDFYLKPLNDRYPIKPLGNSRIIGVVREAVIKFR